MFLSHILQQIYLNYQHKRIIIMFTMKLISTQTVDKRDRIKFLLKEYPHLTDKILIENNIKIIPAPFIATFDDSSSVAKSGSSSFNNNK